MSEDRTKKRQSGAIDSADIAKIFTPEGRRELAARDWPEPEEPRPGLLSVPKLSEDMLPEPLRTFCVDISQRLCVPLDMVAATMLPVMGAAVGRSIQLKPQVYNDWHLPPNLWSCIVARAGFKKSPVMNECKAPLVAVQHEFHREHDVALMQFNSQKRAYEQALRAFKKGAQDPGDEPTPPALRRLFSDDSTWEALHQIMSQNPKGLLYIDDECTKTWNNLDDPGQKMAKRFFLKCWNGNDVFTADRIMRGSNLTATVCLSQIAACQPSLLRDYVRGMQADGWTQRFMLIYPDADEGWTLNKRPPHEESQERVQELITRFARMDAGEPCILTFAPLAQGVYEEWLGRLNNRNRSSKDENESIISAFAKYESVFPQLALLFQLCADPDATQIGLEQVELALRWCSDYLRWHVLRVYNLGHRGDVGVERLIQAIKDGTFGESFTVREVVRKNWHGLASKQDIQDALDTLAELGWVKAEARTYGNNRQQTTQYTISPRVRA